MQKQFHIQTIFHCKTVGEDFLQAAESLLKKGCFHNATVILSCAAFESECKWKIRCLKLKSGENVKVIEKYFKSFRENDDRPLKDVIISKLKELYDAEAVGRLEKLPIWKKVGIIIGLRNNLVHKGFTREGKLATKEDAENAYATAKEFMMHLNEYIVIK